MNVFDLHCDTASRIYLRQESLGENTGQLDLARGKGFSRWVQTFALFQDDSLHGEEAWFLLQEQHSYLKREWDAHGVCLYKGETAGVAALLAIEGAGALGGVLSHVEQIAGWGVKLMTLTWNHANEWASGVSAVGGLTAHGRTGIRLLEENHILIDVSHLNEESFWDVTRMAKTALVATHSNAFSICSHPRNLKDEQIQAVLTSGGLIGVNFYPLFVNGKKDCSFEELARHIEHFLYLGAGNQLALGSDFDGASMPLQLDCVKRLENWYHFMVKCFGSKLTNAIFFENAARFFGTLCK